MEKAIIQGRYKVKKNCAGEGGLVSKLNKKMGGGGRQPFMKEATSYFKKKGSVRKGLKGGLGTVKKGKKKKKGFKRNRERRTRGTPWKELKRNNRGVISPRKRATSRGQSYRKSSGGRNP